MSCLSPTHLSEFFAGPAEGGEQVPRGDRGQADRVHRHNGEALIFKNNDEHGVKESHQMVSAENVENFP